MAAKVYYDDDADLSLLKGKTISILGYGSQGHAQAQNLRDSGCTVVIGQRSGSKNYDLAVSHGFKPVSLAEATKVGDLVNILLPDEVQGDAYKSDIRPNLKVGSLLMCSHGFNLHFGQVIPPVGIDCALVAPKGPGHLVRSEYEKGGGVPSLIALSPGASEISRKLALAYAKGIGGTRGGVIETTIAEETETDLFGEQAVLCGGLTHLIQAGFETLTEAGYAPEMAYFECLHELKLIVDLIYEGGIANMNYSISNNAEYGEYVTGPEVINEESRVAMRNALKRIQTGEYAKMFILEGRTGYPSMTARRRLTAEHSIEVVGAQLRAMMPWIAKNKLVDQTRN